MLGRRSACGTLDRNGPDTLMSMSIVRLEASSSSSKCVTLTWIATWSGQQCRFCSEKTTEFTQVGLRAHMAFRLTLPEALLLGVKCKICREWLGYDKQWHC